jgi:hypothetical protein
LEAYSYFSRDYGTGGLIYITLFGYYWWLTSKALYILKAKKETVKKYYGQIRIKCNVAKLLVVGGTKVTLMPVTGNSEENKQFWNNVPTGR